MPNALLDLKQAKTAALDQASAILSKLDAEKRAAMTGEEQSAFARFTQEAKDVQANIDAREALAEQTGTRGSRIEIRDGATDKPWGYDTFGEACIPQAGDTKVERRKKLALGFGE